ncbi:MAG: ShlB/FhaC/HecB family hemolysin secretion/activation protein [Candidatus Omnitrophica bacterium]|nr:ShlB/FhaC/HecB family hemolysin secretion/activation protein [Candidatus Omnitrophota bacterium]
MVIRKSFFLLLALVFFLVTFSLAAPLPEQEISGQERTRQLQEEEEKLRGKIEEKKEAPQVEEKSPPEIAPPKTEEKILIQKINVTGATLIPEKEINDTISEFQNKELKLKEMQKAADLITDTYRKKGYVTSRAYLPPQKIEGNILEIRVVEGRMGDLEVKVNRYFKAALIKGKITLTKGEPFDYNELRRDLSKINQHPDRNARAVFAPGKEAGTTDLILEVKDRLPIHLGLKWDNFGSRYIEKDRYQATLTHNNLLGFDDIFTLQYQIAEADTYRLSSLRYLFPVSDKTELGFFAARTKLDLGKEYKDLDARGKSELYGFYLNQDLFDTDNIDLSLNLGFDYKDIFNFQLGNVTSRDRLRVIKVGLDLDASDIWGRTIFTNEIDFGIPEIMGGLEREDSHASRSGSGGKFVKDTINLFRLQKMPLSSSLLWKNQIQISPYILTAAEQFQLGGISNVRGYPPAEYVGDEGYASTWEWSFPVYPLPKDIKVPFSKAKLYDALRIVTFYDWGNVRLRRPQAGEEKYKTLRGTGCGIRFNLPEDFALRIDFAWPLDKTPSDENHLHPWFEVSKSF